MSLSEAMTESDIHAHDLSVRDDEIEKLTNRVEELEDDLENAHDECYSDWDVQQAGAGASILFDALEEIGRLASLEVPRTWAYVLPDPKKLEDYFDLLQRVRDQAQVALDKYEREG